METFVSTSAPPVPAAWLRLSIGTSAIPIASVTTPTATATAARRGGGERAALVSRGQL
jgi:hypothetical protein